MVPRGVLPTYVSDSQVVLCKASPEIHNTYEIRLALYMAIQSGRSFALAVSPSAMVDGDLESHIREHGGSVLRADVKDHSVYVGGVNRDGEELDGWVAGDGEMWASMISDLRSPWLKERLRVGETVGTADLAQFCDLLKKEQIRANNIDEEDIHHALLRLAAEANQAGGSIIVQ